MNKQEANKKNDNQTTKQKVKPPPESKTQYPNPSRKLNALSK